MSAIRRRKRSRKPELELTIQYCVGRAQLPAAALWRKWARAALKRSAKITLRLVGTAEARELNRRFRKRDYATNVLTFVYRAQRPLEGDIAICAPVVGREAREQRIAREAHYAHLIVHSVLHLQGYDHIIKSEAQRMEQLETRILKRLGFDDPYKAERGPVRPVREIHH